MNLPRVPDHAWRTVLAAGAILMAIQLTHAHDELRDVTKPVVMGILWMLGIVVQDCGESIKVGALQVPWTRDCAGINLLWILLALAVWVNRRESSPRRFWIRVAAMVPAALIANTARVLTLVAYRSAFYPSVESPQTHYFMGLLWLVPFVTLVTPEDDRPKSHVVAETLHAAAVVALLAPLAGVPMGGLVCLAAVVALAKCRKQTFGGWRDGLLLGAWGMAGAGIALTNLDSLWLPWLLACPALAPATWIFSWPGLAVLLSTNAVFAMQSWSLWVGGAGLLFAVSREFKSQGHGQGTSLSASVPGNTPFSWAASALNGLTLAAFVLPFTASTVLALGQDTWLPPAVIPSRALGNQGYELKLPDQPDDVAVVCFAPSGRERHHTMQVCFKYRGVTLTELDAPGNLSTDGTRVYKEYFLTGGALLDSYAEYVRHTFYPGPPQECTSLLWPPKRNCL
ncbi:archaeosortase/exosortase family protein [Verrucomicrobium spinosum]|uniref:exosortase Z n=1 Tax=Verrucomicrobium spinosum TaxID=2736 RepID=UPI0009467266|nr:archaeosortase/exosortase family protein [Verrucomicrobium spinosum]